MINFKNVSFKCKITVIGGPVKTFKLPALKIEPWSETFCINGRLIFTLCGSETGRIYKNFPNTQGSDLNMPLILEIIKTLWTQSLEILPFLIFFRVLKGQDLSQWTWYKDPQPRMDHCMEDSASQKKEKEKKRWSITFCTLRYEGAGPEDVLRLACVPWDDPQLQAELLQTDIHLF